MDKRPRGRPREYDRGDVLLNAMGVFAEKGFAATSLDDLSAATGMNRPSLYNAFGDKESFYRETLAFFVRHLREEIGRRVVAEPDLRKALIAFYRGALEKYFAKRPSPGCFFFCTAPVEALSHPDVQQDMRALMRELDDLLEAKFISAQDCGEYAKEADPRAAAQVAQGVLHSLAIRARAGESKASLLRMAAYAVTALVGKNA
jgi:AcrR family transcriptional regulator